MHIWCGKCSLAGMRRLSVLLVQLALVSMGAQAAGLPVTVTLNSAPNPSRLGQPVTLSATVEPVATGKVTFYDGTTILGVRTLSGTQVSLITPLLPAGARSLYVHYSGDSNYAAGNSAPVTQTVGALAPNSYQPVSYAAGTGLSSIAQGDFNGDGKPDLVVADYTLTSGMSGTVLSVLLGKGDGTFEPAVSYAADGYPTSVAVGDFNGDGCADLVAAANNGVVVLLGNGDGTFQPQVRYAAGTYPAYVVVGDFNGDGIADLVVTNQLSNDISILMGKGDGTFYAAVNYAAGNSPGFVLVGDFNGDGIADVAIANYGGTNISILLGNGDGTFQPAVNNVSAGGFIASGDFNGDGRVDLVVSGATTCVFIGNGDGTFQPCQTYRPSLSVAVGDFNGDGHPDIALADLNQNLILLFGKGDGTFPTSAGYSAGTGPGSILVGDFNGDGKADLAITNSTGSPAGDKVLVLLGVVSGLSVTSTHSMDFIAGGYASYTLTVSNAPSADATGGTVTVTEIPPTDVTPILVGPGISGPGWSCLSGMCTRSDVLNPGASYPPITVEVLIFASAPAQVTNQVSVSGGGSPTAFGSDVTNINHSVAPLVFPYPGWAMTGGVQFSWTAVTGADQYRLDVGSAVGLADYFSGVTTSTVLSTDTLPCNGKTFYIQLSTHLNGVWEPPQQYAFTAAASCTLPSVIWQDPTNGASQLWQLGGPQGTTMIGLGTLSGHNAWRIAGTADFNGDGRPDVIWQDPVTGSSQVWFLSGEVGTTRLGVATLSGPNAWQIAGAADFNGDGHPDLIWQDPATGRSQVWFLSGTQGTTMTGAAGLSGPNGWRIVGAADFNGDGHPDVIWQDPATGRSQVWFLGGAQGTTITGAAGLSGPNAWRIVYVADLDGDGHPDVIWQDPATGTSQVWFLGGVQGTTIMRVASLSGPSTMRIAK